MMDSFTVSSVPGRESVFRLRGELDIATAPILEQAVAGAEGPITLDCSELQFIDSSGLHVLVRLNRNGGLTLRNVAPNMRHILELTGLDYLCE
jgi:anti-anti-sigma factor